MKITEVKVHLLSAPIPEERRWFSSLGYAVKRDMILVELRTDTDIVGYGEANHGTSPRVVGQVISSKLRPLLLGEDPFYIEKLMNKMLRASLMLGHKGASVLAISGVEIALWDVVGKALNTPIHKLLGANSSKVQVYAGGLALGWKEPAELAGDAARLVGDGFEAIKIRAGREASLDIETVAAVRDAIGPDVLLMVDANGGYSRRDALRVARALEGHDVHWFEEPLPAWDIEGLGWLADRVDVSIAGGENEYLVAGFSELLSRSGADIVQPDVSKCGGILEGKKIAALAGAYNRPCIPHVFGTAVCMAANLQLIAAISNAPLMEYDVMIDNPLKNEIVKDALVAEGGWVEVPDVPGHGAEIVPASLERFPFIDGPAYVDSRATGTEERSVM